MMEVLFWKIMNKEYLFRHIDKPFQSKYRRIYYLGTRSKYPWQGSYLHSNSNKTVEEELMKPELLSRSEKNLDLFPVLFIWEDNSGETKYCEATIN